MIRINKTKNSKFLVLVGWAGLFYCDNQNEVNHLIHIYGQGKVTVKPIGG